MVVRRPLIVNATANQIQELPIGDDLPITGRILQYAVGTQTTRSTLGNSAWANTNLSVTITPTYSTSSILIVTNQSIATSDNVSYGLRLLRGATVIYDTGYVFGDSSDGFNYQSWLATIFRVDQPSTTGAVTYSTQGGSWSTGTGYANVQQTSAGDFQNGSSKIYALEISP